MKEREVACERLFSLCEEGFPLRHLRACAEVTDEGRVSLSAYSEHLRKGPYPLYRRGYDKAGFDDYGYERPALLVGAMGAIATRKGKLLVIPAFGSYAVSDMYHVIFPQAGDFEYLQRILSALDAGRLATGTNASRVVELGSLRGAIIPWPEERMRRLFVETMGACEVEGASDLATRLLDAWMGSVHAVDRIVSAPTVACAESTPALECERMCNALDVADKVLESIHAEGEDFFDVVASTFDLADPASLGKHRMCVCFPPPNQGLWSSCAVSESDDRWMLGLPPRNKANYAWIQQTISCMAEGGTALLLLCDAALHTESGREKKDRAAWASSGLIEAVISLPGGIFEDGRLPSSFVVMKKGRRSGDILFVNARERGERCGTDPSGYPTRCLSPETVERIARAYADWVGAAEFSDVPGFCRSVSPSEIEACGHVLAPWAYIATG